MRCGIALTNRIYLKKSSNELAELWKNMIRLFSVTILLITPSLVFGDASPFGRYFLGFGYSHNWDEFDRFEGHSLSIGGNVPIASKLDLSMNAGYGFGESTYSSPLFNEEYSSIGVGLGVDVYHKFEFQNSVIDCFALSGGGGFGLARFSYEATGLSITPYENSETRFTYSLGLGAGVSLAETFWLSTGLGFADYINKDYDEIVNWGIGVTCFITDGFYIGLGYSRRLNYFTQERVSLSTGYRW